MNRRIAVGLMIVLCSNLGLCCGSSAKADDTVRVGVLAKRGARKCLERWGETGKYLQEQLDRQVEIIPLKFVQIEPKVAAGEVDFVLANSAFFAVLKKKHDVRAVASLINSRQGKALTSFGGVVLVRADSPIESLQDIKGKKFMCVKYSSFGGGHMAWRLLLENGIDPQKDCAAFIEGNKHDNVVLAVRAGAVDVGTVRTDTLERMAAEGAIKLDEFRVLNPLADDFPFVRSTRLYPEWPMAACKHTPDTVATAVAEALTKLGQDDTAAEAAKVVGWSEPLDYAPVAECLMEIEYDVFAH